MNFNQLETKDKILALKEQYSKALEENKNLDRLLVGFPNEWNETITNKYHRVIQDLTKQLGEEFFRKTAES